ncbi:uncharacterized protein EAF01_010685 [Botrytis porri]|nr:uncharacterized protein EAF01_010685 [Botrytis porri]KAF7890876.1 hypothetical protein EAF01_010685 [Botrytis porri]
MIQRCQLSSAANCFLNSHREDNDAERISMDRPTAPYYDGHNWKSTVSVAMELERHRYSMLLDFHRIGTQMEDSIDRLYLGCKKAKKVDTVPQTRWLVQRGTVKADKIPAHLQTPFVLNPTPSRVSEWPRHFENSHLSEHTGRLGLPLDQDHVDVHWSRERLKTLRASAEEKGRKDQRISVQDYHDTVSLYIHNPKSPGGNGPMLKETTLYWWDKVPQTMAAIDYEIFNGTDEEKKKAETKLTELENLFRRNQLKRKQISGADGRARKAQKMANLHREFKRSGSVRDKIEDFEHIKERGGEGYLAVSHHLSAVPGYMIYDFQNERQLGTGLWNSIGPGNGVKRARSSPVWRIHDPYGAHSSLRLVSNASSEFQEKYVTKATYSPPTSIHTVDGSAEPLQQESDPEDTYLDWTQSDETNSDETVCDEIYLETDSDECEIAEEESIVI